MNMTAVVESVMIADDPTTFVTRQVTSIQIELGGIPGDRHYGLLRPADSRQKLYPRGTMIANRRQLSIVSREELAQITYNMKLPDIHPEWLGANLVLSGYGELTQLEVGARLLFPDGTGLICEGENLPCLGPGKVIEHMYEEPGLHLKFVPAARRLRGIVCSVEREGNIDTNERVSIVR